MNNDERSAIYRAFHGDHLEERNSSLLALEWLSLSCGYDEGQRSSWQRDEGLLVINGILLSETLSHQHSPLVVDQTIKLNIDRISNAGNKNLPSSKGNKISGASAFQSIKLLKHGLLPLRNACSISLFPELLMCKNAIRKKLITSKTEVKCNKGQPITRGERFTQA